MAEKHIPAEPVVDEAMETSLETKLKEAKEEVKKAILEKIEGRFKSLSNAREKECNIASRYDLGLRVDEVIALFNEIANTQL